MTNGFKRTKKKFTATFFFQSKTLKKVKNGKYKKKKCLRYAISKQKTYEKQSKILIPLQCTFYVKSVNNEYCWYVDSFYWMSFVILRNSILLIDQNCVQLD